MKLVRPVNDSTPNVTSPFSAYHIGVDYGYTVGTPVYASADGTVTFAKGSEKRQWLANTPTDPYRINGVYRYLTDADYGNFIKIAHLEGFTTIYAHLQYDSLYVKYGDKVKKGQLIAKIGSTGNSTGNHLHWEPALNGRSIDPNPYMDRTFTGYFDGGSSYNPAPIKPSDAELVKQIKAKINTNITDTEFRNWTRKLLEV